MKPKPAVAITARALGKLSWPHAPLHELSASGIYFLTAGTYGKEHYFRGANRLAVLHRGLLKVAIDFGWRFEAWAVFSNHYHFVAHSPPADDTAESLSRMLGLLHEKTAKWINKLEAAPARQFPRAALRSARCTHSFREERRSCAPFGKSQSWIGRSRRWSP